ncbi:TIGR00266 family protein [Archaeoglobus neptunius]|uniref:TIGR00266 family protein n=1 Tax=Archaeoglobus neptunius TaxID=2798580 RepID=UPI0019285712|nr:TIGR00266 family protein [Archaeoglobus neptunius]
MEYRIVGRPSYSLVELKLKNGEEVVAETGAMVYMKNVELKTEMKGGLLGGLKRSLLGGESLFLNRFVSKGDGLIGLAPPYQGDIVHLSLNGRIFAQSGAFLASSPDVSIDTKWGGAKTFFSGEGIFLLKLEGSGDLFLSSFGSIEEIEVDGTLRVDTGHIVAFEDSLSFRVTKAGGLKATLLSGEGLVVDFSGSGRVWIQTRSVADYVGWLSSLLPTKG